jgi:uncharacterized protein (DUF924 family)
MQPADVVDFWTGAGVKAWFKRDADFDAEIGRRFEALHQAGSRGELADWAGTAQGALSLVLLLDQFPRNMYRGSAHAFATDPMARALAKAAVEAGFDLAVAADLQPFFYLPFEHHEDSASQARGVDLCGRFAERTGDESYLRYARLHADIIARFGRFPHRNLVLGRISTPAEMAFLADGGFAG